MIIKKILFSLCTISFVSVAMAATCDNMDEKFTKIDASKIGTKMYDKKTVANKIDKSDYSFVTGNYTGGRWEYKNSKDNNLNVKGFAICTNDGENMNFADVGTGPYCWCHVESVDGYRVDAKWENVKEYNNYTFDATKYANNQSTAQQKEQDVKNHNIKDCMEKCSSSCRVSLVHEINGYYACAKALYKLQNVKCIIDNNFISAKSVSVFDDIAEIETMNDNIILNRESQNNFHYSGEYDNKPLYLQIKNNQIYVGRKQWAMEECM